ncbi:ComEC/Rec2 family competence protein [Hansschlegelia zhihuaiae]|uniref:MBL fold metallo-hydrolase n=1 Tax=Hansschlegelia zhihuaiae TaxID=405005 RepID=A0A4Q0MH85_9HYPH|nr:MBL fold metallo-hydrolase [Hansschlegelia zhihuaiae]RXF72860.1 MBL fold metallo-hydrolase [Hansschlegelia zhihuaiae]
MFRLTMLPAEDGDCLLLDYGTEEKQHHVLIDGGRTSAYTAARPYFDAIRARGERIDLLVLTHIDADHIEGLLPLIADERFPVEVAEVWYNGFDQLSGLELYGPEQGDAFSAALKARAWPWNTAFGGAAVVLSNGKPFEVAGPGGLKITLLSPTRQALAKLRATWVEYRQENGLPAAEPEVPAGLEVYGREALEVTPENVGALATSATSVDRTVPNGSSIAFIAEHEGRRLLLAADAHPSDLVRALRDHNGRTAREIHLAKISHHGSKANTTKQLVQEMSALRFAISTSGARNKHPNPEAIARLIHGRPAGVELHFNYRTKFTEIWDAPAVTGAHGHRCFFGSSDGVISIDV